MNQWAFVIAAYAVTAGATAIVSVLGWRTMRRAEKAAERLSDRG